MANDKMGMQHKKNKEKQKKKRKQTINTSACNNQSVRETKREREKQRLVLLCNVWINYCI